jgi:exonuclease SbcC
MHKLIGAADGKKFRNFAQALTFEHVVHFANKQLRTMTDRYILMRDPNLPLELHVIDVWQGGLSRTTKNLSGGESFLVSLALALALSRMVSKHGHSESLFLDEGFGTLDEETLNTALEALARLQKSGRLIGVISHIAALRDRIGTQICVKRESGGKSSLHGPGCSGKGLA